jgi:septum formation inhibitor-activating ATPase MinD
MQKSNLQITSDEINEELVRIKLENFKKIEQMDVDEVEEFLNDLLISTDIVVEGMNLVSNLTSGEAIAYRALAKLAQGIELAIHWIQSNTDAEDDDVLGLREDNDEL